MMDLEGLHKYILQLLHKCHTLVPQRLVYLYEYGGPESKVFSLPQGKLAN